MPTSSTTITDQASGNEVATQTITEDSVTKHLQRVSVDQRQGSPCRRYSITLGPSGGVTALTTINSNIGGILAGTSTIWMKSIMSLQYNTAAGTIVPIAVRRVTTLTGGTLVTAANVQKHVSAAADSDAVIRYGSGTAATGEAASERLMLLLPQGTIGAINAGGASALWVSNSLDDNIVLAPGEGLFFEVDIASDTDNRYLINLSWEETA